MVGSIIPSSRNTIARMLAPVDWDECKLFVEYGPGVGTFCRPVLDRLPRDGALVVIDTNPLYIDYLKRTIRDSRFHPVLGSAEDVEAIIAALGFDQGRLRAFGPAVLDPARRRRPGDRRGDPPRGPRQAARS